MTTPAKVDRARTTPFLLNLYYNAGAFHRADEFRPQAQPRQHIQIYTWRDCTLHELALLLADALPAVVPPRARLGFRLVYADAREAGARYATRDLGVVVPGEPAEPAAKRSLGAVQFIVGDWIDVAVYTGDQQGNGRRQAQRPAANDWRRGERVDAPRGGARRGGGRRYRD